MNNFKDIYVHVPEMGQIIRIAEGTGDNLTPEDEEAGYVDYIYYDQHNIAQDLPLTDGGQILSSSLIRERYDCLADAIPDVFDKAFGRSDFKYVILDQKEDVGDVLVEASTRPSEPTVRILWSENVVFREGEELSAKEFNRMIGYLDAAVNTIHRFGEMVFGTWHDWYHAAYEGRQDDRANGTSIFLGYEKVSFELSMPSGKKIEERYDIGDMNGGLFLLLESEGCSEIVDEMKKYYRDYSEIVDEMKKYYRKEKNANGTECA